MWSLSGKPPTTLLASVFSRMPDDLRRAKVTAWTAANKPGMVVDCFLEGPQVDREGNVYVVDIPHGRIFKISRQGTWQLLHESEGWPNGSALDKEGHLWIADYRRGILRLNLSNGHMETVLGHRNSESFKGVNDLVFDGQGHLYFTDQGQTGLHDPSGRVYRYELASGRLDQVLNNLPSPNGLVLDAAGKTLFVALTRANQVWRGPVLNDGAVSKMGAFQSFFGTSGPDGLAMSATGQVLVAHASLGGVFVLNPLGEVTHFIKSPVGPNVTNVSFAPDSRRVYMTESATGSILTAEVPEA
jgi:gluconolactonase